MSDQLAARLEDLARVIRVHIASNQRPNLDMLAGWRDRLREAAEAARALAARAATADEMEAIAADLDLIGHARSGEVGPIRPRLVDEPAREPVPRPRAGAPDIHGLDITALDNTVGDDLPANVADLREALTREHREAQAAIEANERRIEQLRARDGTHRRNSCGNDVLLFPYRGPRRPRLAAPQDAGSPDDGDAA